MHAIVAIAAVLLTSFTLQTLWLLKRARAAPPEQKTAPKRKPMAISVLIPSFNEGKLLGATVHAVMRSKGVYIAQVICIDNASTDDTCDVVLTLQQQYGEVIQYVVEPKVGKASALNHGLSLVTTAAYAGIDADTQILPDTLQSLSQGLSLPDTAAVSGHLVAGGSVAGERMVQTGQLLEYAATNNVVRRALAPLQMLLVIPGSIGLFSTQAVRAIGGYSESTLAEDRDITLELLFAGHRLGHAPGAWALTEVPDALCDLFKQRVRWSTGKFQIMVKHSSRLLGRNSRNRTIWLFGFINDIVQPLTCLPALLGLLLYGFLGLATANCILWPSIYLTAALANILAGYAYSHWAWRIEVAGRTAKGLNSPSPDLKSGMLVDLIGCLAAWCGMCRAFGRHSRTWGKLERRANVSVPAQVNTPQHPADISDTKQ